MKINKQDEYGLRILLRISRSESEEGLSIPQLSELEELSQPYVAKITRALRLGGLIESTPGQRGGYVLTRSPEQITIKAAIDALGGQLYTREAVKDINGKSKWCIDSVDCSMKTLWSALQQSVDMVLENITLQHLTCSETSGTPTFEQQLNTLRAFVENRMLE
ncbi:MAG: Rrf2 family transcriptional regulator [Bacteroidota bacterium]